jgi:pilus assembly protein CpaC
MRPTRLMASALALALAAPATMIALADPVLAQSLRVQGGTVRDSLSVAMNRAVVVESEVPFVELSIANPGIADISTLSDRSIYVLGKAPGRTTLTILGDGGELIANVEVHVAPDIAEFRERLRQILPSEPIEVRTANDGIVMSGTASSITRLDAALQLAERYAPGRVSNLMTVGGTQQVMLRVRFSEVQRGAARNLSTGINAAGSNANLRLGQTLPGGDATGVLTGSFGLGSVQFQVMIEALESEGLARTLSEPSLTALSGQ